MLLGLLVAAPCGAAPPYAEFVGLEQGRQLWLDNCEGCHGYGTAGAPIPMIPGEWKPRLAQDKAVLYRHAIEGFFGPDDAMMPARGGNDALSDAEVRAAVDYMTTLARHHIDLSSKTKPN